MTPAIEAEKPTLFFDRAAVALHFVERGSVPDEAATPGYPDCPVLRSMELDLLNYPYQEKPLFGSHCHDAQAEVSIHFPHRYGYRSEGRLVERTCPDPVRRARAILTSTDFLKSGLRVFHLTLVPAEGERFSELDIIRLIHLYGGQTEQTGMADLIRFRIGEAAPCDAGGLLRRLLPGIGPQARLMTGTVQILTGTQTRGGVDHAALLETLQAARAEDGTEARARIAGWMRAGGPEADTLMAWCGIVTGIFDFREIGEEEVLDTLEPTYARSTSLIRIHRRTMTSLSDEDRLMTECRDSVGISPYLLIPHAVILHNEALVDEAERTIAEARSTRGRGLGKGEAARRIVERNLDRLLVPNVFNYATERTLYEGGSAGRGLEDTLAATRAKLVELSHELDEAWERRRDAGQLAIAALLAILSVLQVKEVLFELMGSGLDPAHQWLGLGLAAAAVALFVVGFWRLGRQG
ncbi:MAG: hypothetical protein HXY25_03165 [Alphaproteobacteria bacterium]|nr:hypothetical protein [Alphaproteobacteria bacterium]